MPFHIEVMSIDGALVWLFHFHLLVHFLLYDTEMRVQLAIEAIDYFDYAIYGTQLAL